MKTRAAMVASLAVAIGGLGVLLVGRALMFSAPQEAVVPDSAGGPGGRELDEQAAATRLSGAIKFATISHQDPAADDPSAMAGFRAYLAQSFPAVYAAVPTELIGEGSLLFTWAGTDPAAESIVLLSHMDVVPISPGTEKAWLEPPFGGVIADGYIWGRGTLDDKSGVLGLLEAVDRLLAQGFKPRRTFYLAFGHDEEVGGNRGAGKVAETLKSRGVHAEYVLDEGGVVGVSLIDGLSKPAAMIGIAEKGYMTVELTAEAEGGHSSTPPRRTAIGRLSRAVARLEDQPMPLGVGGALKQMLLTVGPEMNFGKKVVMGNLWLFEPLVARILGGSDAARASMGTTMATTIFQSGDKENVLPAQARAVINLRLLPGDTQAAVLAHMRAAIDDDSITLKTLPGAKEASPLSSAATSGYRAIARAARGTYPDTVATPFLTIGGTDSIHYEDLSPNVYRFLPAHFGPGDLPRFHGTNERIGVKDYADTIRFFTRLIRDSGT